MYQASSWHLFVGWFNPALGWLTFSLRKKPFAGDPVFSPLTLARDMRSLCHARCSLSKCKVNGLRLQLVGTAGPTEMSRDSRVFCSNGNFPSADPTSCNRELLTHSRNVRKELPGWGIEDCIIQRRELPHFGLDGGHLADIETTAELAHTCDIVASDHVLGNESGDGHHS